MATTQNTFQILKHLSNSIELFIIQQGLCPASADISTVCQTTGMESKFISYVVGKRQVPLASLLINCDKRSRRYSTLVSWRSGWERDNCTLQGSLSLYVVWPNLDSSHHYLAFPTLSHDEHVAASITERPERKSLVKIAVYHKVAIPL